MRLKMEYFLCICMGKLYKVSRFRFFFYISCCYHRFLQQKHYFNRWFLVISVSGFFLVSRSYGQNTKQDTLLCARVRSQMKNKFSFLSRFQNFFRRLKSGTTEIKFKNSKFTIQRKSHNNVKRSSWRNKEFMFTRRRLTFTMMLLTNQTQYFVLNRATCIYLFLAISLITLTTSTLNSPCLFFQSFTAEKLNLATIILFPL